MYCTLSLLVLTVAVAAAPPSTSVKLISGRYLRNNRGLGMYDGTNTTIQKHPYLVSILDDDLFYCAGTIVSRRWVVTSGDCVYQLAAEDFTVVAGSSDAYTGTSYKVKKIVLHPKYFQDYLDYDYACIQIKGKFKWSKQIKSIKLGKNKPTENTTMLTAGWGQTSYLEKNAPKMQLREGKMNWTSDQLCKETCSSVGINWTPRIACAYNKNKTTLCLDDWSDPFVYERAYYGLFISGIAPGFCSSSADPIILANVADQAAWIKKTTGAKYIDEEDDAFENEHDTEDEDDAGIEIKHDTEDKDDEELEINHDQEDEDNARLENEHEIEDKDDDELDIKHDQEDEDDARLENEHDPEDKDDDELEIKHDQEDD